MCNECARSEKEKLDKLLSNEVYKNASPIMKTEYLLAFRLRQMLHLDEDAHDLPLPETE